ncbi:trans-sialidase, putative, partial [Trypanosoma cruzi marinkellei]
MPRIPRVAGRVVGSNGATPNTLETDLFCFSRGEWTEFIASGGSGVVMEDGTLVFPLMTGNGTEDVYSMIIYSTDNGSAWALSEDISPAECLNPRVTEWEGPLLMIVDCEDGQRVHESRDTGATWTETIGTLSGVWVNARSGASQKECLHVDALITATIEGGRVMLYTRRGHASGEEKGHCALPLGHGQQPHVFCWTGCRGQSCELDARQHPAALGWQFASLQRRGNGEGRAISLSSLAEEPSTIKSVLSTWAQKDIFF